MRLVGVKAFCLAVAIAAVSVPAQSGDFELLKIDGQHLKWGVPAFATGATVSYSYVKSVKQFPSARNCRTMAPPSAMISHAGMSFRAFDAAVKGAFAQWSAAADIRFHYVDDPDKADILLGAQAAGHGIAFTNVVPSANVSDAGGVKVAAMEQGTICFNPSLSWNAGQWRENVGHDFRTVAGHEIGHAIGLDHPGARGAMMAFKEDYASRVLQKSDIEAVRTLYGRPAAALKPLH